MQKRDAAIEAVREKVPSIAWLADQLNLTRGAVSQWSRVPAERVVAVEKLTGIPRQELRPDLYDGMEAGN